MKTFSVPQREEVSQANQVIFDTIKASFGKIPNLYASFAYSETALSDYLNLQNRKTSLSGQEKEVINLVVSQVNNCQYCIPAHTFIAKMLGFTDEQIVEIRKATISFDFKLASLARFVKDTTVNRGRPSERYINDFLDAGYNNASIVDVCILIGDKTISNYLHSITQIPVDWPEAPSIEDI